MIVQEQYLEGLIRTYSDSGFYIRGGNPEGLYEDAIDRVEANREYTETDIPIESEDIDAEYVEAAKIMLGEEDI